MHASAPKSEAPALFPSAICQVRQISRQDCAVWISGAILSKRMLHISEKMNRRSKATGEMEYESYQ
jgi:hypothetical protein